MSKKTFYVTTPIFYPSGNLHIGHVYTTSLAWVLRNYKQANGYDAVMLTGADEHGQKIENKAKQLNISPQKYVNNMTNKFKKLWKLLDIDYDIFSRTTNKNHIDAVRKQFSFLFKNNKIFIGSYNGLYSINDEEFLTKINAIRKGKEYYHPLSGHKLQKIKEESYFFKMSDYEIWIKEYFHNNSNFIFPKKIVKELLNNFINKGLEDLSISRKSFKWGISIKENSDHIIYVWLDALNNYITALGYNQKHNEKYKKYWLNGDEIVHIIGKEIIRFHCIYWPIILNANGIRQPTKILSHGWILTSQGKMSKSKGNVINPLNLIKKYGNEQIKYYLVSQINIGKDGIFEEADFIKTINADLSNNIGNLVSRTIAMSLQNFKKPIKFLSNINKKDEKILNTIKTSFNHYKKFFDEFNISKAIKKAIFLSKELNGYINITKPWKLKNDKMRLEKILNTLLNGIYAVITMLNVVMPQAMKKIQQQININELTFKQVLNFNKFDNILVKYGDIIFKRI